MTIMTMDPRNEEFIISESNGYRSRESVTVTVPANTTFQAGTVLGTVTTSGKRVRHDSDGTDDGRRTESGVLCRKIVNSTSSSADFDGVQLVRDAEVRGSLLIYEDGANAAAKIATNTELAGLGIIVR